MSKPDPAWRPVGMRHQADTEWTRVPGAKDALAEVENEAASGSIYTRIRRDGQRELLEIKNRR